MKFLCLLYLLIVPFSVQAYSVFWENGRAGLKNSQGKVVIPPQYDELGWSSGDFSLISNITGFRQGNLWGLISVNNQKLTAAEFENLLPAEQSFVIARKKNKGQLHSFSGVLSIAGKVVVPFMYDGITISSFRAIVFTKIGNQYRYGLIDLTNKTLIPQSYQNIKSIGSLRYGVQNFEGKFALFSEDGKQMTEFNIDSISAFRKDFAVVYQGRYQGLIDRFGKIALPPSFREIRIDQAGNVHTREYDHWLFLNGNNQKLKSTSADSVSIIRKDFYKLTWSGQVQVTNERFVPVINGVFDYIGDFNGAGKASYGLKGLSGVIQEDGTVVVPAIYQEITIGTNYFLAKTGLGNTAGWILFDSSGIRKTTRIYQSISGANEGLFIVRSKGFFGLINLDGKEVVAPIYDSLIQFRDNHIVVKFHNHYGVIDRSEKWVVSPRNNRILLIRNDRFLEYREGSTNLRSIDGTLLYFTSNPVIVRPDCLFETVSTGQIWMIDFNGVIVDRDVRQEALVDVIYSESEGYRAILKNGRYGFVDSKNRLRIANRYEGVKQFSEGMAAVKILGKWGYINTSDNLAIQPVFEEVNPFKAGRALVKQKGLYGLIDKTGKQILPVRYEVIEILSTSNIRFRQNGLYGLTDGGGSVLVTPRYDELFDTGTGYAVVRRENKYGVVSTTQGVTTIPIIYDHLSFDPVENIFLALERSDWKVIAP